jgi:hypothetical protein
VVRDAAHRRGIGGGSDMIRIGLHYARPHMHLAEAVEGPDGAPIAGVGTTLTPDLVRFLLRLGITSVVVREAEGVAAWEEEKDLADALRELDARFANEGSDPLLDELQRALRRHLARRAAATGEPA